VARGPLLTVDERGIKSTAAAARNRRRMNALESELIDGTEVFDERSARS
jgi:hypothetical protein